MGKSSLLFRGRCVFCGLMILLLPVGYCSARTLYSWAFSMRSGDCTDHPLSFHDLIPSDERDQYTDVGLDPVASDYEAGGDIEPAHDSLSHSTLSRLLPTRISTGEKFLWGENGFFREIGLASPLSLQERKHELVVRRTMLTAHQIGGFITLVSMIATVYYGQRVIDGHRNLSNMHNTFVLTTILSYSATGLLSILSPPPLIRRDEESTITLHKTLAWIHFGGMVLTPILGQFVGGRRHLNISRAHVHQVAGYITTAAFATAMIVVTF